MSTIYTIGFTKKSAKNFFELLKDNNVNILIDIRLNNTSQLAGFSKYPDIKYFLNEICNIEYIHDVNFAPENQTLDLFKKHEITWDEYVQQFNATMENRQIFSYIKDKYDFVKKGFPCLLCSEVKADKCHRSLVANYFSEVFKTKTIHL